MLVGNRMVQLISLIRLLVLLHVNSIGPDQHAYPRKLISGFVVFLFLPSELKYVYMHHAKVRRD